MSSATSTSLTGSDRASKLIYIDNIKVILTILVVLHHTFITYGSPGGWYYTQKTIHIGALIPMTMFVSINQSFFMGFFFLLAAYFYQFLLFQKRYWQISQRSSAQIRYPIAVLFIYTFSSDLLPGLLFWER